MSLQLAAQHLASRGRGPDTTLVHMAPQEVAGLQALAKAHGGSLTINPDTGLAEAGFLSSILPMVAGAFLGPAGLGLTALQSGLAAGALGTLATGSLKKGLMAGLGAYGGAGLAGSVMGAGTSAGLGAAAGEAATAGNLASQTALAEAQAAQAAQAAAVNPSVAANAAATATPEFSAFNATNTNFGAFGELPGSYVPPTQAGNIVPTTVQAPITLSPAGVGNVSVQDMLKAGFSPEQIAESAQEYAANTAGNAATPFTTETKAALENPLKAGFGEIVKNPKQFLTKDNLMYAGAAAAPFLFQEPEKKAREEQKPYEYSFNYNRSANPNAGYTGPYTGERTYFNPTFTRTAAGGGLMDLGPVEAMSNRNEAETLMANGGQMFAEGGETKAVAPVEDNPFYTMTGQSGDAFKYLMGQGPRVAAAPAAAPAAPAVVATPASVASATGDLTNSYVFNPSTGTFASIGSTTGTAPTVPVAGVEPQSSGSSYQSSLTPQQAAVFDFMNTEKGQSYKDMFGAANSNLIGSLMPGSIALGAIRGQVTNPITAFRDANAAYSLAERAMQAQQAAPVESRGGSVEGFSNADPGGMFGGAQSGDVGFATGGIAALAGGGQSHLGDYSDGGRLLRGPGNGTSDSIPASIGDKRPARLADGEFVVPARIVSELGNGSTEAGARQLYAMMDRIQKARGKTVGKNKVAVDAKARNQLPA